MSKLMNELKYQLSKIDFTKYSGDEIEESVFVSEINSFASSQAIEFNKWCDGLTDDQRYGNDYEFLYKKFLLYQKKQQEGKGE